MSSIPVIATTPLTSVTAEISSAPQAVIADQPQATANASYATISAAAMSRAGFEEGMADRLAGRNQQRAMLASDPSNPLWAKAADELAHHNFNVNTDIGYDISQTLPPGDGILRYSSGEPVTAESQAYATQQGKSYQNQVLQLYNSEMAKGTPSGDILVKIFDLQEQQPARFRAMSEWPVAADFASNQPDAISGSAESS